MKSYSFAGPAEVRGFYQNLRDILQPFLILIFLGAPWVRINQQPLILFDIFNRHFIFFGFSFFSHDAPLLFYLVILVILSIFIVTTLFGRLWCGWSCPQTVFIHVLFNKIEKLVLGSYTKRALLFNSEDSLFKKYKILIVYAIFFTFCWILAHSFMAYFLGSEVVTQYIQEGPAQHLNAFVVLMTMTCVLFFNFAFFREKFCFYICPYGRFQNALIDSNSLVVFYDTLRGEPRGKVSKNQEDSIEKGDCVDCKRCVAVCPTKIDIREGFQLECIACGKCIDACNEVMYKTQRQASLIRYETGDHKKINLTRFRLALYFLLVVIFLGGLVWTLNQRNPIDFNVSRSHSNPFSHRIEKGKKIIQNQIQLHLKNQTNSWIKASITLSDQNKNDGYQISTPVVELQLAGEQDLKTIAFIEIEESRCDLNKKDIQIILQAGPVKLLRTISFIKAE